MLPEEGYAHEGKRTWARHVRRTPPAWTPACGQQRTELAPCAWWRQTSAVRAYQRLPPPAEPATALWRVRMAVQIVP